MPVHPSILLDHLGLPHAAAALELWLARACGVRRYVVSPLQAVGIWEISLGHPIYLRPKGQRENSMLGIGGLRQACTQRCRRPAHYG